RIRIIIAGYVLTCRLIRANICFTHTWRYDMQQEPIVYVVDDDQAMVESLTWIIESVGLKAKAYTRAQEFLDVYEPLQHGCILLDVRMPGMSGPELQAKLNSIGATIPIIFISGHGDV